ncbi:MAG: ATP-binding protein [Bacteroidales bacterium]|nr:ATP-binding protein [Bacteroidales bacterium]
MDRILLKSVIYDQRGLQWDSQFLERGISESLISSDEILVITGVRRCGKSTLLQQIRNKLKEKDYYLNFDDDRLIQFTVDDFQDLFEVFIELFGKQQTFYFDEIQNIKGWERFVRRLYDYGNKVFITGSNATILSRELGTHLTGRYISFELYPFSFKEFLAFKDITIKDSEIYSTESRAEIIKHFHQYTASGGFPLYIRNQNIQYLKSLYESILYRDIMVRNNLTNEREILELVYYLASNVSKLSSFNSLAKIVGISNASTIKNYLTFFQNSYLIFHVNKFDYSLKKQIQNPKKIYFIDLALVNRLGFSFSDNRGRTLENLVFLELKRRGKNIYYHRQKTECDFIIKELNKINQAIQVSASLYEKNTYDRELKGLKETMEYYKLDSGLIITENEEDSIEFSGKQITIKPAWKWLLGY